MQNKQQKFFARSAHKIVTPLSKLWRRHSVYKTEVGHQSLLNIRMVKQTEGNVVTEEKKVQEFCQWETMEARCRWNSEVIVMTSARWGRMKTGRCLNIHPKLMASNSDDLMFLGCSEDVLSLMDQKCSSKPSCDVVVPNPDLDKVTPCYEDLTRYLEASYVCVKGKLSIDNNNNNLRLNLPSFGA